jgi:transposase
MMGIQDPPQGKLFYTNINLDQRIRANHPLRKINQLIDFDFAYQEVESTYGSNGNVSVPPPVILKLMLLLLFYNVRSERELMSTLPERLDWLWFLGYDLDSDIPGHSVLSKAKKRWGVEVFKSFFERIVLQCVQAGLVDGRKIFIDSSLIDADASNNSVIDTQSLRHRLLHKNFQELDARLDEREQSCDPSRSYKKANKRYISSTDPDAAIVNRGKPKLSYQVHRAVDGRHEIITATDATPGDVNEAHLLGDLLQQHHDNTDKTAQTVVADSKYGTIDNFLTCHDLGVAAHMPDLGKALGKGHAKSTIFGEERFRYDADKDVYHCPAGQEMKRKSLHQNRNGIDYAAPKKVCAVCELRDQCTRNKMGRTVKRHLRQDDLDRMRQACQSAHAKRDIKTRQHLMERSFARAKRYGFDRARWRGLWKMQIQEYLICAIQNIQVLIGCGSLLKKSQAMALKAVKTIISKSLAENLNHLMLTIRFLVTSSKQTQRATVHFCN